MEDTKYIDMTSVQDKAIQKEFSLTEYFNKKDLKNVEIDNVMFNLVDLAIPVMNCKHNHVREDKDDTLLTGACFEINHGQMLVPSDIHISSKEVYDLVVCSHSLRKNKHTDCYKFLDCRFILVPFTNKNGDTFNIFHSLEA